MVDQKKDLERLGRYITRERLVSVMNDTKWANLRELMVSLGYASPRYRVMCLRADGEKGYYWDGDWYYHLPIYKTIEWLEIDPIVRERRGQLLDEKKIDHTQEYMGLLKQNRIPFSLEGEYIRIWGYQRPGHTIEFA